jgi:hypothetical protein
VQQLLLCFGVADVPSGKIEFIEEYRGRFHDGCDDEFVARNPAELAALQAAITTKRFEYASGVKKVTGTHDTDDSLKTAEVDFSKHMIVARCGMMSISKVRKHQWRPLLRCG